MTLLDTSTALDFLGQYERILGPFIVLIITYVVARLVTRVLHGIYTKTSRRIQFNKTQYAITARLVVMVIWILGILSAISLVPELNKLTLSLFAGAGVLALVIGLAAQKTTANMVGGVTIAMFQPFRVGDRIKVKEFYGKVEDITLRDTVIRTGDNARVIIPNSVVTEEIISNYSIKDEKAIKQLDFGISYDSDIDLARSIILSEVRKHPDYFPFKGKQGVFDGEQSVVVKVVKWDASAVVLRAFFWAKDQKIANLMEMDLLESVKKRFDAEGVEIPFPYQVWVDKKDLPKPAAPKKGKWEKKGGDTEVYMFG